MRVYDIRDLTVRVPNFAGPQASFGSSNEESVVTRAEGIKQVLDTITRSVEPNSWAPAGTVGSINDIRGLLFVTQTFENHVAVTHILNALKQGMKDIRPGAVPPEDWPESEYLFAPDGSIHPWVADLLDHAAKGKLSKFSSVEIAQAGDRKFANIGGYWLDVSLTVSHKILPLAPASAAMREVIKRRPGVDKALELGPYVVVAVGPEQAVSADRAGAASAQEPEVKKLLDSVKGQG